MVDGIAKKALKLVKECAERCIMIATAESCTGGLLSTTITEIPGASEVFDRGFITYSNIAKAELLGIDMALIEKYGAISREVAEKMAEGALKRSRAAIAVSITGIAGPAGGTNEKPVGLVYIGTAVKGKNTLCGVYNFAGARHEIRTQAVEKALDSLVSRLAEYD